MEQGAPLVRCTSPVHIHVDEETPVHVHVKKLRNHHGTKVGQKSARDRMLHQQLAIHSDEPSLSITHHKSRSKSPSATAHLTGSGALVAAPWVPPPAKTTKSTKYAWQGSSHRLEAQTSAEEVCAQIMTGLSCQDDLDTDEEDRMQSRVRQYEKRIETLMQQVSTLKNEIQTLLAKTQNYAKLMQNEFKQILNTEIAKTMLQTQNQKRDCSTCDEEADQDKTVNQLMKQLDKVDKCAESVSVQMTTLSEALQRQKKEARRGFDAAATSVALSNNRQLLLDKLTALDTSCRRLRHLLIAQRDKHIEQLQIQRHRQELMDQVKNLELACEAAKRELAEKDVQISELKLLYDMRMDEVTGANELHGSLEMNKSQLERQLRQRDVECSQMALEIRNLQNQLGQERCELENLQRLLLNSQHSSRQKSDADRKSKKSSRQRDDGSVDGVVSTIPQQLSAGSQQPVDQDALRIELSSLKAYCDKLNDEKTHALQETNVLKVRIGELETIIERMSEDGKKELATVGERLQEKTSQVSAANEDIERLQMKLSTLEYKLAKANTDADDFQSKACDYERTIEEYRSQMTRLRRETDETLSRLDDSRRELVQLRQDSEIELDKVKQHMHSRLSELEQLPELLKSAEVKIQQLTEQLEYYKKLSTDNNRLVTELTAKVDQQTDFEAEKRDLLRRLADREETVHQANVQVQEVMCDNATLKRRLESVLADSQRKAELERDKLSARERAQRAQILDLETQLNQMQAEILRLKHDKDESERRFNSQLYDMRDRLEQSHSTNRSLQNYVEFLKNSYTTVFADHVTSAPPTTQLMTSSTLHQRIV